MSNRRGLTLVEMLLALAIVAMLLAAVAVAVNGSMTSMRENDRNLALAQMVRWTLNQITTDIRTASSVSTTTNSLTVVSPANTQGITQVRYMVSDGEFCRLRTIAGVEQTQVLLEADGPVTVSSMAVATRVEDGTIRSVSVTLNLNQAGRDYSFTASASPRRNQDY